MLGTYWNASTRLDPSIFEDEAVRSFAETAAEAIEEERTRRGGNKKGPNGKTLSLLGLLADDQNVTADLTPWFDLLTSLDAIQALAKRRRMKLTAVLTRIIDDLQPLNWQTFYWLRAYIEALQRSVPESEVGRLVKLQIANERRQAARVRGQASGAARLQVARAKPHEVVRAFEVIMQSREHSEAEAKRLLADRFNVTVDQIRKVLRRARQD